MKNLLFAGLLGAAALFSTGCSDACEKAANRLVDRQEECGVTVPDTDDGDGDGDAECTDAAADTLEKLADCAEKATCEKVKDNSYLLSCGS